MTLYQFILIGCVFLIGTSGSIRLAIEFIFPDGLDEDGLLELRAKRVINFLCGVAIFSLIVGLINVVIIGVINWS